MLKKYLATNSSVLNRCIFLLNHNLNINLIIFLHFINFKFQWIHLELSSPPNVHILAEIVNLVRSQS